MNLDALTTAGTLALSVGLIFLVSARLWHRFADLSSAAPSFPERAMREAAQRFRDEAEALRRSQGVYLATLLTAGIIFAAAIKLDVRGLYQGYPRWQLALVVILLACFAAYLVYKAIASLFRLASTRFRRDASMVIGQQLLQLTDGSGCIFHDVEVGRGTIDHVMVGQDGAIAIHVIARTCKDGQNAALDNAVLKLGSETVQIEGFTKAVQRLSAIFSNLASRDIQVRSVVAVPGWNVAEQRGNMHLLVNEQTLPQLTGWQKQSGPIRHEDVAAIQNFLGKRTRRA